MANMKARNWATTIALTTTIAVTGGIAPALAATAGPVDGSGCAAVSATAPVHGKAHGPKAEALTETYTSPDGVYSFEYPATWTLSTEGNYPVLTSPDGTITGHLTTTGVFAPNPDWFGRAITQYRSTPVTALCEATGTWVDAYSAYSSSYADPAEDTVRWGLFGQNNLNGLVNLGPTEGGEQLWVNFEKTGVNKTGSPLSDKQAARVTKKAVGSRNGATVKAILQSVRINPDAVTGPDSEGLKQTYTSPDGRFSVDYPATWTARMDRGYLELTSPDGSVTGHVSSTDVLAPDPDRMVGRDVKAYRSNNIGTFPRENGSSVDAYAEYVSVADPALDTVEWGLTGPNGVNLSSTEGGDQLWAYFEKPGVNKTGESLTFEQADEGLGDIMRYDQASAEAYRILHSIRVN